MDHKQIEKAVIRSQHCQRNWDLSKQIPQEDLDLIEHAITNCPSKQNVAYYKVHMITDRQLIENIHSHTKGFTTFKKGVVDAETNSQTLANLLIVFEAHSGHLVKDTKVFRNDEILKLDNNLTTNGENFYFMTNKTYKFIANEDFCSNFPFSISGNNLSNLDYSLNYTKRYCIDLSEEALNIAKSKSPRSIAVSTRPNFIM